MGRERTGIQTRPYPGCRTVSYRNYRTDQFNMDPDTIKIDRLLQFSRDLYMPEQTPIIAKEISSERNKKMRKRLKTIEKS